MKHRAAILALGILCPCPALGRSSDMADKSMTVAWLPSDHSQEVTDVFDKGAKGDGRSNDLSAIRAAVAEGKPIFFPFTKDGFSISGGSFTPANQQAVIGFGALPAGGMSLPIQYSGGINSSAQWIATTLSSAGTSKAGSANQWGSYFYIYVPRTNSPISYEKGAVEIVAQCADPSATGISRDCVAADLVSVIRADNRAGSSTALNPKLMVDGEGHGSAEEIDVFNNSISRSAAGEYGTTTSKVGLNIFPFGLFKSTSGIAVDGATTHFLDAILVTKRAATRTAYAYRDAGTPNTDLFHVDTDGGLLATSIDNTPIGQKTPADGTFNTLKSNSALVAKASLGVSAAGTGQSSCTALKDDFVEVTSVGTGTGVCVRAWSWSKGEVSEQKIVNAGASALALYPASSSAVLYVLDGRTGALGAGAAYIVPTKRMVIAWCESKTLCYLRP